jgi:tRNA threonylcarbamoyladenosine biosynthesis protein TsaB
VVGEPLAGDALALAVQRIGAGDFDDAATLDANYLRRTDREIFAKTAAPRDSR